MPSLIPEAHAQTAEATKVAADAANILLQYQVLGAACIFLILMLVGAGFVIRHLYNDLKLCNGKTVEDRERLIKAIESSTDALEGVEGALNGVKGTLETRAQAIVELSHQFEIIAKDLRHGLGNLSQAVDGLVRYVRDRPGGAP